MLVPKRPFYRIKNFFHLKKVKIDSFWSKFLFFSSGGDALIFALQNLKVIPNSKIIVPSYICKSVPEILRQHKYKPIFVDISSKLMLEKESILKLLNNKDIGAIMLVDFFGFQHKENVRLAKELKDYNLEVIIDRCHSNIPNIKDIESLNHAGAIIYSFRKTFSVKNGGALLMNGLKKDINRNPFYKDIIFFILRKIESIIIKIGWPNIYSASFDYFKRFNILKKNKRLNNNDVSSNESLCYSLYKQLSDFEDINNIQKKRMENYMHIKDFLFKNGIPFLFNHLDNVNVPQVFPIIDKTHRLGSFLNKKGIGAYRWPGDDLDNYVMSNKTIFPNTINANNEIICIPIHQGIEYKHLNYIKKAILEYASQRKV